MDRCAARGGKVITAADLKRICPLAPMTRLEAVAVPLNDAMREFGIDNPARETAFLAQVAHESGSFRYVRELASGAAYEGRADLGNIQSGDGVRFRGRGFIQITGRANYRQCSIALFGSDNVLVDRPELLEDLGNAARSAGWFWTVGAGLRLSPRALAHGVPVGVNLNDLADKDDFLGITLAINGGMNGYADRWAYFERAQEVLV